MSKIKLTGDAGGTGIFTIASPNSSTDRTITLPDDAGTIITSAQASTSAYSFVIDEDNMATDSATKVPTQQSVKAYVDAQIASENTLAEDNDVNITSAADGSLLLYDTGTSTWRDAAMSGDATITDGGAISLAANTVDSSELVDGSVDLSHMSANSVDSDQYVDGSIDLAHMSANSVDSDQYVDGSIDTAHIAADNITSALIADDQIDSEHIVDASIDLAHMSVNSIDSDQYVDASIDLAHMSANSIDSDQYVDGSIDLVHMSDNSVDSDQYVDGSIDLAHMSANSVDSDQYVDGSVDNVHLANSSVTVSDGSNTSPVALGGTLTFAGTANEVDVVESAGTVTYGLPTNVTIAGNLTVAGTQTTVSSTTIEVADPMLSLATSNNAADAVDIGLYGLYDTSGSQDLYGGIFRDASDSGKWKIFKDTQAVPTTTVNTAGTGYAVGTLVSNVEGALSGNSTTATALATGRTIAQTGDVVWSSGSFDGSANVTAVATIQANAVDSAEITSGAIDLAHMSVNSIDSDQYVDGSIDLAHMSANSVDSDQYVDGSIDLVHMSANSVDSDQYVDGSIDTAHIAADNITSALIADDQIDSEHIVDGSVDLAHMSANSVDSDQYVDGSVDNVHLANSTLTVTDGSNSTALSLGGTATFSGTANEVEVGESSGTITIGLPDNVTIAGNLTVSGTQTTISSTTINVADPLLALATNNNAADAVDIGFYGLYDTSGSQDLYSGMFRDANDSGKWKLFKDTQAVPTTTVNTSGTGYVKGTLVADIEGNITGAVAGNATTATALATGRTIGMTGDVVWTSASFDGSANVTAAAALQANTVDSAELVDGSVDLSHMSVNSIDSDQYVDGSIDLAHMSANSVDSDQYVDGSIDTAHIAADQITSALIADDQIDSEHIVDASIDLAHMSVNSIDSDQYVDGSIDTAHIAADQITAALIADDVVNSEHIAAGAVDLEHMSVNSIDSDQYVDGSIDLAHMSANSVDSDQYVDGSVDNVHMANSSITVSDGSNTTAMALGSTVTFAGTTNEVNVAESSGTITIGLPDNVTIAGNLTVSGTNTSVSSTTIEVADPLLSMATNNGAADAVDIGLYGLYDTSGSQDLYGGLFRDASDSGKWKLFKDNQAEPTTTVNTAGTGYAVGTLVANLEGNGNGTWTGNATTATALATARTIAQTGDVVWSSGSFDGSANVTAVATIQADAVDSAEIASGAIDLDHMSANSVDSDQYVDGSIDLAHMSANSVDSDQYVDLSIDNAHLAADCITASKIGDDQVNATHIGDDVINSEHYAADSIDEEHIANDAVGSAELKSLATLLIINSAGTTVNTIYGAGA